MTVLRAFDLIRQFADSSLDHRHLNTHQRFERNLPTFGDGMMISLLSLAPLLFSSLASASFDCSFDLPSHHFNLNPLKGVHIASNIVDTPPTITNTTVFIDLCQTLHWNDELYDAKYRCKEGTQGASPIFCELMKSV